MPILSLWALPIIYFLVLFFFSLLLVVIAFIIFSKKIKYDNKFIDIKEAPLEIDDILRDPTKRTIIKKIGKEKIFISQLGRRVGHEPAKVRFHLKRLEKFGLVKQFKLARETYFRLTNKGLWCLDAINYFYPNTVFDKFVNKILGKNPANFRNNKG